MEIKGKLIGRLQVKEGTGSKGDWKKQSFIIQTDDKFPKQVCLTAWNKAVDVLEGLSKNCEVNAKFSIESKEYKGNWYTELKVYSLTSTDSHYSASVPEAKIEAITESNISDLPFN